MHKYTQFSDFTQSENFAIETIISADIVSL